MTQISVPRSVLEQFKEEELNDIYKVFIGMDQRYVKKIRDYHKLAEKKDVYNTTYLYEERNNVASKVIALKREYVQKANEVMDEIADKHAIKLDVKHVPNDKQDRIAYELQRQNDMKQWELQFQIQQQEPDLEGLKTMYDKNWGESDFLILFDAEMQKLKNDNKSIHAQLMNYIESMKTSPVIKEIDRLRRMFGQYANMEYYPYDLQSAAIKKVELRNVNNDLTIPENFHL